MTLGTVIMTVNAPTKVVAVYGRGIMMNLHSILCKVNANSSKLFVLLEPTVPFGSRLMNVTTFFEIAVASAAIETVIHGIVWH